VPTNVIESKPDAGEPAIGVTSYSPRNASPVQVAVVVAAGLMISLLATSSRSLWIDEACTAVRAIQPTLGTWWQAMVNSKTGCLQMPLYMLYTWGWTKLFGASEWSFHLANVPWFAAGAVAFNLSFPAGQSRRLLAGCLVLLCPFAWYYLDEARPYAIQLGASLMVIASLRRITLNGGAGLGKCTRQWALFLLGIVILCGSSLFGTIWAAAAMGALLVLVPWPQLVDSLKRHLWLWLAAAGPLIGLAVYYVWTLKVGARGSEAATTTLGSMLFVAYELLGFAGLGPGRLAMRSMGLGALQGYLAPVALYAVATAILLGAATWHTLKTGNRRYLGIVLCCCLPLALILGAGWVVHFRVLGRHLAPFVPALVLLCTFGASALWSQGRVWARVPVVLFCVLSLASCLSLRFAARHEKDNYRAAATFAKAALRNGELVWWNAAGEGAVYYAVPVASGSGTVGEACLVVNPLRGSLGALPPPGLIVASKPDVYDNQTALAEYIRAGDYHEAGRLSAFVLWERNRKP
jgi:hypothetical protein